MELIMDDVVQWLVRVSVRDRLDMADVRIGAVRRHYSYRTFGNFSYLIYFYGLARVLTNLFGGVIRLARS